MVVSQEAMKAMSVGSKTTEVNCHSCHLISSVCTTSVALGTDLDPLAEFVFVQLLHCILSSSFPSCTV